LISEMIDDIKNTPKNTHIMMNVYKKAARPIYKH